ncbi:phage tail protein [Burkholderia pseudomultivorans]|uniref:phage tail protein n=1 Tax=Burkholderia pseudomultivorans TaxID=1207504 RepID=UPI00075EE09F|nr:phage tail protein [Burkholderia pseudomultivorans]KWF09555.1 oxidoreductase [Burkholderia pseudomultivorans]
MLLSLDQFVFSLTTAPFHELKRRRNWKHPKKSRIGVRDARQYTGQGDDVITLDGLIAPDQIGTSASLDQLVQMANVGEAYVLVDGLGTVYGAYIIVGLDETRRYFTREGAARRIEFTLTLECVDDDALRIEQEASLANESDGDAEAETETETKA